MEPKRKNINRGFTKLRVWQDSLDLYKMVYKVTKDLPYELNKSRNNILDASNSILRNISEGYCRRNLKEYLNFLNIALGSCGELLSGMISFYEIKILNESDFEKFDELHYKVENELINLIKSLQQKQNEGIWQDSFAV
jgi:four helix bundle protein